MSTSGAPQSSNFGHIGIVVDSNEAITISELNLSLHILATIFPRILPEVFREMLPAFHGDSRLHVVVDQLLKNQDRWVKGRWRMVAAEITAQETRAESRQLVAAEDEFRQASYRWAVYTSLCQEFEVVSRSAIKAVLAEENYYYTRARPTLQKLSSKTWRSTFKTLWARFRRPIEHTKSHYMISWLKDEDRDLAATPVLKETGDAELDVELYQSILRPFLEKARREQESKDWDLAIALNEKEAEDAQAIFECECCFSEMTFERMASCTTSSHAICYQCIQRAISEALFGQSWGRNINHTSGQIRCVAPTSHEGCDGCIPQSCTQRAIAQAKGGKEIWRKLEARLAEEALAKTRISLVHCPFCTYAEVDELYLASSTVRYRLNTTHLNLNVIILLVIFNFLPLLILYSVLCRLQSFCMLPTLTKLVSTSLSHIVRSKHLSRRFYCRSPCCGLASCLVCSKLWRDPHICHESATLSLRTTVEAARTAALKRTCPRCGLAFIKDSGCNKLTCVCGYTMCYVCRQGLGKGEGDEGYRHFCQHFRPLGGLCKECDKCDLYKDQDGEGVISIAGVKAEKEWREREGMIGVAGIGSSQEESSRWSDCKWTLQDMTDWVISILIIC